MNRIEEILKNAEENGIGDEVREEIEKMNYENKELKQKNKNLQTMKSNSMAERYRKSNENLKEKNKELNKTLKYLKKKRTDLSHLTDEQLGVYKRLLDDYNSSEVKSIGKFPERKHPIFNHFNELANQYPNRKFLVSTMRQKLDKRKELVDFEIKTQEKNIAILENCIELQNCTRTQC